MCDQSHEAKLITNCAARYPYTDSKIVKINAGIPVIIVINVISQLMHWKAFADCSISPPWLTLMKEYRVLPYIFRNSALMSNMSISALATIILMRTLSVVPSP